MKFRITFLSLAVLTAFAATAQNVEQDDMYFRSKDRATLAASKPLTMNVASRASEVNTAINPTDSYSARNVNPEYLSQSKVNPSSTNQTQTSTYFVPNYTPTAVNQNIYNNPGFSNYYGSRYFPSYGMNSMMGYGMGMGMYGMGSPYNSFNSPMSYYDPYGYNSMGYGYNSMYNNSYGGFGYPSGLSFSLGMGYGNFNNYWGNSFYGGYGYNSMYSGFGYRPHYGYGGSNVIIVNNGDGNGNVAYGKRSSRSSDLNNNVTTGNRSTGYVNSQGGNRSSTNGRVAANNNNAGSYYQRGWRTNPETNTRSAWNNTNNSSNNANTFNNGNTNHRSSNSDFTNNNNSRSSWSGGNNNSNFSSGGNRGSSVAPSSGGSSGGGARRGRD